jgi:hypothetical protein
LQRNIISLDDNKYLEIACKKYLDEQISNWMNTPEKTIRSLRYLQKKDAKIILDKASEYDQLIKTEVFKQMIEKDLLTTNAFRSEAKKDESLLDDVKLLTWALNKKLTEPVLDWVDGDTKKSKKIVELLYPAGEKDEVISEINSTLNDPKKLGEFIANGFSLSENNNPILGSLVYKILEKNINKESQVKQLLQANNLNATKLALKKIQLIAESERAEHIEKAFKSMPCTNDIFDEILSSNPDIIGESNYLLERICQTSKYGRTDLQNAALGLYAKKSVNNSIVLIQTRKYDYDLKNCIFDEWTGRNKAEQEILFKELTKAKINDDDLLGEMSNILQDNPDWLKNDEVFQFVIRNDYEKCIKRNIVEQDQKFTDSLSSWVIKSHWNEQKKRNIYHIKHKHNDKVYIHLFNADDAIYHLNEREKENYEITIEKFKTDRGSWPIAKVKYIQEKEGANIEVKNLSWRRDKFNNNQIVGIDVDYPVKGFIAIRNIPSKIRYMLGLENDNLINKMKQWIKQEEIDDVDPEEMEADLDEYIRKVKLIRKNGGGAWIMEVVE